MPVAYSSPKVACARWPGQVDMAKTYRFDTDLLPKARSWMIRGVVSKRVFDFLVFVVFLLCVIWLNSLLTTGHELLESSFSIHVPVYAWLIGLFASATFYVALLPVYGGPILALFVLFAALDLRSIGSRLDKLASVEIDLGEDSAVRRVLGEEDSRIQRDEVTHIQDHPDGFVVLTGEKDRWLGVPDGMEEYEELRTSLLEWGPLKSYSVRQMFKRNVYPHLTFIPLSLGFVLILVSRQPVAILLGFLVTAGTQGWDIWEHRGIAGLGKARLVQTGIIVGSLVVTAIRIYSITR